MPNASKADDMVLAAGWGRSLNGGNQDFLLSALTELEDPSSGLSLLTNSGRALEPLLLSRSRLDVSMAVIAKLLGHLRRRIRCHRSRCTRGRGCSCRH